MSRIQDFGEKIGGARKDVFQKWIDRFESRHAEDVHADFISQPLSKAWPHPNYTQIEPTLLAAWLKAAREELGRKPGRYQLNRWALKAQTMLHLASRLIIDSQNGVDLSSWERLEYSLDRHCAELAAKAQEQGTNYETYLQIMKTWLNTTEDRCRVYQEVGVDKSLANAEFNRFQNEQGQEVFMMAYKATGKIHKTRFVGESFEEAFEKFKAFEPVQHLIAGEKENAEQKENRKISEFTVVSIGGKPEGYIAVKRGKEWIHIAAYETVFLAREALRSFKHHEAWEDAYQAWLSENNIAMRSREKGYREGSGWRANDENITPQRFMETFGFRGVEFGNYVEGPRRQEDLNNTYDGLMDLAYALDVSPKSLSLDGTLGLAFGARGRGGIRAASAHYEPDYRVINLTKSQGAGSLAHEFFHAMDHFLADALYERSKDTHIAEPVRATYLTEMSTRYYFNRLAEDSNNVDLSRALMQFKEQVKALNESPVAQRSRDKDKLSSGREYWGTTIEVAARTFESAVKATLREKGIENSYLVDIAEKDDAPKKAAPPGEIDVCIFRGSSSAHSTFPYPFNSEIKDTSKLMMDLTLSMLELSPIFSERFDLERYMSNTQTHDEYELEPYEPEYLQYHEQSSLF